MVQGFSVYSKPQKGWTQDEGQIVLGFPSVRVFLGFRQWGFRGSGLRDLRV